MDVIPSVLIYKSKFQPRKDHFQIPLFRQEPTLTMMFQEKGTSWFNTPGKPLLIAPNQHSLNYFPDFDCRLNIPREDFSMNTSIKLKPDYFREYIINNQHVGGWFYENMVKNETGASVSELFISPEIKVILHQIRNCPYDSLLRRMYIDGLIRILLTYQLDAYNQIVLRKKPVWQDQKITTQDVGKLHDVKDFISRNYSDPLNLYEISRKFGLNEYKLKFGFKKLFGIPVMQCIIDLRLNE
jgi:hypothetical protein